MDWWLKYKRLSLILIIAVVILGGALTSWLVMRNLDSPKTDESERVEEKFYDALGNAARQQKLRVAMYRETFASKAEADTRQNVGTIASSVSELDTKRGYRSVFAHTLLNDDKSFKVGRCMDGKIYNDYYQSPAMRTKRAKTLQDAASRLSLLPQGNLYEVTQPLILISCPRLGLLPSNPPIAEARLSDGVFPVTLSEKQAENWQEELRKAKLFTVKDEGMVEKAGVTLRKMSFYPAGDELSVNQRLHDIFYRAGEIAKIKSEQPKAQVDYEFQAINPGNTGGIRGFYLIDEDKNLPVYSELTGINQDKLPQIPAAKRNIARTKQTYSYPSTLTISLTTPLEFLE